MLRVVSCSNLIPIKRVELLARVLAGLTTPFEWTHFGDGPSHGAVEKCVREFPKHGRARLAGTRPNSEVLLFFRENPVDVFVNLSESEGVPVSIMEALAHGVPTVATDVGGTKEIVDDCCGKIIPRDFSSSLLESILRDISDRPSEWAERRVGATRRWSERCNAETNYAEFSNWLAEEAAI